MYQTGKLTQVTAEIRRYKLHILGVNESGWTGSGRQTTTTGETALYSGREDSQHHDGVAMIPRKGMEKSLLERKPFSSCLMRARLRGRHTNIILIQCYAPTNDREWRFLSTTPGRSRRSTSPCPYHCHGDQNAKLGSDNMCCNRAMGKHGCGTRNKNGERLIGFRKLNNFVIGGTLFPHQDIHKRRCTDQILILRNITEQCTEWQRQLYISIVDFEKAFDNIHRDSVWRILRA